MALDPEGAQPPDTAAFGLSGWAEEPCALVQVGCCVEGGHGYVCMTRRFLTSGRKVWGSRPSSQPTSSQSAVQHTDEDSDAGALFPHTASPPGLVFIVFSSFLESFCTLEQQDTTLPRHLRASLRPYMQRHSCAFAFGPCSHTPCRRASVIVVFFFGPCLLGFRLSPSELCSSSSSSSSCSSPASPTPRPFPLSSVQQEAPWSSGTLQCSVWHLGALFPVRCARVLRHAPRVTCLSSLMFVTLYRGESRRSGGCRARWNRAELRGRSCSIIMIILVIGGQERVSGAAGPSMEREAVPTGVPMHSWQCADARRRAWAHSRDSCQVSHSQGEVQDGGATEGKTPLAEEMGRIPSKIATWLQECRTPLGSSLDESNQGLPRGTARNGCSFEDDLSLGAEANYLQASGTATLSPCFGGLAKEKRSQFQQRASSMNSTGSGRSNTTVSSISELLDLYEEDPEEVLYNLGFGIEEPDIASKVPARFFSSASNAKGIDMKVYLGAQLKRMELENPSYALTSRFRQIEVLTTVANAFSVLYSQVSGAPVQQIGGGGSTESREPPPLRRNNSALNAAKLLKKSLTRLSLQNPAEEGSQAQVAPTLPIRSSSAQEQRHPPSLATVTEEALPSRVAMETEEEQGREPDRLPSTALARVRLAHMLPQKCDSFEMEEVPPTEVQSLEGEALLPPGGAAKAPGADLQRMASQHSDSSGFAEDPPADGLASPLKVQDSADSYDSDATVTSATVGEASALALHHTTFPGLGDEDILTVSLLGDSLPLYQEAFSGSSNTHWSMEQVITFNPNQTVDPAEGQDSGPIAEPGSTGDSSHTDELGPIAERGSTADSSPPKELSSDPVCGPAVMQDSGFEEVPTEPIPARAVTISQPGLQRGRRVWLKPQDLLVQGRRQRFPLQRSHSLPTSLLGPTCVVSSVRIQLRPGTTRCCTPPSFSYRYTPEDEEASSVSGEQEGEEEERTSCRSVLLVNRPAAPESGPSVMMQEGRYLPERRPAHPLHLPPYLSCSASSLQSSPPEWSQRVPGEHMRDWSSFSVPNLQAHSAPSSSVCNCHSSTQPKQYPLHISLNALPAQQIAAHNSQHGTPYVNNQQRTPHSSSLHSVPYSFSCSNLQSAPFNPPCDNLHGAPCSSSCSNLHSVPSSCPWSHVQNVPLSGPHLWEDSTSRRSTELQLQEILQEIRASVQHLS
ncbi:sperm-specific antigen 2-like, partial [Scleropages formosus]